MKRVITIMLVLYTALYGINLSGQTLFNLEEATDYALLAHSKMKVADLESEDALWEYRDAKSTGMPKISIDGRYNYNYIRPKVVIEDFISPAVLGVLSQTSLAPEVEGFGGDTPATFEAGFTRSHQFTAGLNASVFVFNGNYLKGLKAAKLYLNLAKKQKLLTEQDIRTNVLTSYQNVLVAKKNIGILDNNISNVSNLLDETQALYDNGFAESLDVARLQLSKENLLLQRKNLDRLIAVSKNVLKYQMAFPLHESIDVVEDLKNDVDIILLKNVDLEGEVDFELRPEHGLIEDAIALDEADLVRIKQGYVPSLYANVALEESVQRDRLFDSNEIGFLPNGSIGLRAYIPIYDGGETRSRVQKKKIELEKRNIELSEFRRALVLQIYNARAEMINAKETLINTKKTLAISEEIYRKTQIKYKEGVGSSLELSQAEAALYQSQANYINSMYSVLVAQAGIDIATGEINKK